MFFDLQMVKYFIYYNSLGKRYFLPSSLSESPFAYAFLMLKRNIVKEKIQFLIKEIGSLIYVVYVIVIITKVGKERKQLGIKWKVAPKHMSEKKLYVE